MANGDCSHYFSCAVYSKDAFDPDGLFPSGFFHTPPPEIPEMHGNESGRAFSCP